MDGKIFTLRTVSQRILPIGILGLTRHLSEEEEEERGEKRDNLEQAVAALDSAKLPNYLYINDGSGSFRDFSKSFEPSLSNGAASADFDLDGDLDIVINNINAQAFLYENITQNEGSIQLQLIDQYGNTPEGAYVEVSTCLEGVILKNRVSNHGYLSTGSKLLTIGIGDCNSASVKVFWPSGRYSEVGGMNVRSGIVEIKESADLSPGHYVPTSNTIQLDTLIKINLEENRFNDFDYQSMLPIQFSRNGPSLATVDLNKDGSSDLIVGRPLGQHTLVGVRKKQSIDWIELEGSSLFEDQGILVFDANNDGHKDIYVASGGYESFPGSVQLKDRLYLGDEAGHYTIDNEAIPDLRYASTIVIGTDFDNDGDIDLFIGGDAYPKKYPLHSQSVLLRNTNGKFEDASDLIPDLDQLGIIKTALWTDFNNDDRVDLIVGGLFTEVIFYKNIGEAFERLESPTEGMMKGWWLSILGSDVDLDGDIDYLIGNWGENVFAKPTVEYPLITYLNDFDRNNTVDFISVFPSEGKYYPSAPRDMLLSQLSYLKKEYNSYQAYANATFEDLPLVNKESTIRYEVNSFQSVLLRNNGDESFEIESLPEEFQTGPILNFTALDIDQDGYDEFICSGGWEPTEVIFGKQTAIKSSIVENNRGVLSYSSQKLSTGSSINSQTILLDDGKSKIGLLNKKGFLKQYNLEKNDFVLYPTNQQVRYLTYRINDKEARKEFYLGQGYYSQSEYLVALPINSFEIKPN